jgi:hypothetical protein
MFYNEVKTVRAAKDNAKDQELCHRCSNARGDLNKSLGVFGDKKSQIEGGETEGCCAVCALAKTKNQGCVGAFLMVEGDVCEGGRVFVLLVVIVVMSMMLMKLMRWLMMKVKAVKVNVVKVNVV